MKFTATLAILATAAATVSAQEVLTNGERMARGLPPRAPVRRWSSTAAARRSTPSNAPSSQCNTGPVQCCNSVQQANNPVVSLLLDLLNIGGLSGDTQVGTTCSPLSAVGVGSNSCSSQTVCCENNSFNGVVAIGCTPININL
ncbi:hypothetical protein HYPSUDRAFT_66025 [Hypholoma sublateritium FD-334 SS-4]|uniref:Hydrophobin n=1 Tax=Hypholoma sublateritium (strain FD-334 SS-4) TaxID=945553 RepID=A0A0D2NYY5_HYPSF|nr:hypothetical protein HYPSUDRAFT_66025 [Hypholoma sublateritium FD-334 SS-4]